MSDLAIIEPWERQQEESEPAFEAFKTYRDLRLERSYRKVAELLAKDPAQLSRWSMRHSWVERCRLFDVDEDRQERAETTKRKNQAIKRHAAASSRLTVSLMQRLQGDDAQGIRKLDPNDIDWNEVPGLLRTAIWGERISYGEPTDLVKGAQAISIDKAVFLFQQMVEIALEELPEERHAIYVERVQALGSLVA